MNEVHKYLDKYSSIKLSILGDADREPLLLNLGDEFLIESYEMDSGTSSPTIQHN